ncbi:MAG: lysostaphin resistance A-like protein, partial [Acidimicrobiales bacterium]
SSPEGAGGSSGARSGPSVHLEPDGRRAPGPEPPAGVPASEARLFSTASSATAGIGTAIAGFLVGSVISAVLVAIVAAAAGLALSGGQPVQVPAVVIANLVGLWVGLTAAVVIASRAWGSRHAAADFGLRLRPWPDLPLGVAVGLGSQFVLIPLVYLPFRPFYPGLDKTLSHPAHALTVHASGAGFVVLGLFIALGAPVVEELFFRGLLLRALDHRLAGLGRLMGPTAAVVLTGAAFGLAHGEGLVLAVGLGVFGVVLGVMAEGFGRLGPGIVAHATFNAATVVALALLR